MPKLRHALTGGIYQLEEDGLVYVEEGGRSGRFHADGRWHSGDLRQADPHLILWLGGPRLGTGRARRGKPEGEQGDES